MKRSIFFLMVVLAVFSQGLVSCVEDTEVENPYVDWQARNEHFLDSIVEVARANVDGDWEIYRNYKVNSENVLVGTISQYDTTADETDSIYMRIIEPADADGISPLYTDTVYVYYRGSLINGTVFDENYENDLNTDIYSPTAFALQSSSGYDNLIVGWETALQNMKEGERVMLYVPSDLGYGDNATDDIPGHSVLIFDLKLESVVHPVGPDD